MIEGFATTASDLDFVLPEIWEGPSEELHLNDEVARSSPFNRRVLSGITSVMLMSPELIQVRGWKWPSKLVWDFQRPMLSGSYYHGTWKAQTSDSEGGPWTGSIVSVTADDETSVISSGSVDYLSRGPVTVNCSRGGITTMGRTVYGADGEIFNWWVRRSRGTSLGTFGKSLPWPVFLSLCGGMCARAYSTDGFSEILNRAIRLSLFRELEVGETFRGAVQPLTLRESASRPGSMVGHSHVTFHKEGDPLDCIASFDRTLLLRR